MKLNKLLIAIIIIILVSTFILFGCEKQRIKNEIIQFDKEYWDIAEGYLIEIETFGEEYSRIVKNDPDTMEIKTIEKVIELQEDYISYYSNYIKTFRGFHIPEPMDEFYYKKLEQFDNALKSITTGLNALNIKKYSLELIINNKTVSDGSIENSIENYKQLLEECEDYDDRVFSLGLECDKLRREVYREYGLEDLLDKWQQ